MHCEIFAVNLYVFSSIGTPLNKTLTLRFDLIPIDSMEAEIEINRTYFSQVNI